MKRLSLIAGAIAGLALPVGAQAADRIKLGLGGFSIARFGWAEQDDAFLRQTPVTAAGGTAADDRNYAETNVTYDSEVFILGETTLDNGLTVGVYMELEAGGEAEVNNDSFDQSYVFVQGGFGKIQLGTGDHATKLMHVSAPQFGMGLSDSDVWHWILTPTNFAVNGGTPATFVNGATDAEAINYFTPRFAGFQLGLVYIPESGTKDSRAFQNLNLTSGEGYGAAINYDGEVAGVGVKASAAYYQENPAGFVTTAGNAGGVTASKAEQRHWTGGLSLSYAGFSLGGSYHDIHSTNADGLKAGTDGYVYDVGIAYETGPWGVSLGYLGAEFEGEIERAAPVNTILGLGVNSGKDEMAYWQLAGKYNLGPGIDLQAMIVRVDYDDERINDFEDNEGWGVITGIAVNF